MRRLPRRGDAHRRDPRGIRVTSYLLLILLWGTCAGIVSLELRRRSPALLFALAVTVVAGLPCAVYLFTARFERAVVHEGVLFISAFNILYLAARLLLPSAAVIPDGAWSRALPLRDWERRFLFVIGLVFMLPFLIKLAGAGFSLRTLLASSWREGLGPSYVFMMYAAHASFGLVLCLAVLRRHRLAFLALAAVAALVVVDRRRALGVAAVAPLLLVLAFWAVSGTRRWARLAITVGAGVAVLVAFFLVQQIRYLGPLAALAAADPGILLDATVARIIAVEGDLALVDTFLWMLTNGPHVDGFGTAVTLQRMALFWLPGGIKPPEFTHAIAAAVRGGQAGASLHPTIYGLAWGEARWLGLLYAPFLAVVFRALDRVVASFREGVVWTVLLGPYSLFAVLAARGALSNAWVVMLSTTTALVLLARASERVRFRKPAVPPPRAPVEAGPTSEATVRIS